MNKAIICIIFLLIIPYFNSFSCTCIGKATVKEALLHSDVVFTGKVFSKKSFIVKDSILPNGFKSYWYEYQILLKKTYKGKLLNDTVTVITRSGNGDCGFNFIIGYEYLIYAEYHNKYFERGQVVDKFLYTDICTRTKIYDEKELIELENCIK